MSMIWNNEVYVKLQPAIVDDSGGRNEVWDEISLTILQIRKILLTHGDAINSIQLAYESLSSVILGHRHGGDGEKIDCINLEPWEDITAISGYYGPTRRNYATVVTSLTIHTNRATYGPFGRKEGTPFCFNVPSGLTFAGFHGKCNSSYLCAIGVYLKTTAKYHFLPNPGRLRLPQRISVVEELKK